MVSDNKRYKRITKIENLFKISYDPKGFDIINQTLRKIILMVS